MQEIPPEFYDSDSGKPFTNCKVCEGELLFNGKSYFIEKVVKRYPQLNTQEVLFEYAICYDCAMQFQQKLSSASRKSVEAFFQEQMRNRGKDSSSTEISTGHCLVSGATKEEAQEYQIVAQARGAYLYLTPPFMISGPVLEQINELLSPETRDELDRFKGDNFGWPPELAKAFGRGNLMLV